MKYKILLMLVFICFVQISCEDFVEIDVPDNLINSETVFSRDDTANNAVVGIYNELFRSSFSSGSQGSVTVLTELSADNLRATYSTTNLLEFEENEIFIENSGNLNLWSSMYNIIYMTNAVIEGLHQNSGVSPEIEDQLVGEAKVLRAFAYFYLVNLYNEIPLILTADYRINNTAQLSDVEDVYDQVVNDLEAGIELLEPGFENGERLRINQSTAMALLARVQFYRRNWEAAEEWSSKVIADSQSFSLLDDLDEVFLANSDEAIWQISPLGGGTISTHTNEGNLFIMLDQLANVNLTHDFISGFRPDDLRFQHWIGSFESQSETYYFPYKYKIKNATSEIKEYSMVLRLAEQYLIRSEALAHQGKLEEASRDLDIISARANQDPIAHSAQEISQAGLLELILDERRRELFTEWGHRWLDLKRYGKATEELKPLKSLWQETDEFYPIPQNEIIKNPNLTQNPGY